MASLGDVLDAFVQEGAAPGAAGLFVAAAGELQADSMVRIALLGPTPRPLMRRFWDYAFPERS